MIYRKAPAHPPRLLLCVIAGAATIAPLPACSSHDVEGSVVSPCETHLCGSAADPDAGPLGTIDGGLPDASNPCGDVACGVILDPDAGGVVGTAPFEDAGPSDSGDPCALGVCDAQPPGIAPNLDASTDS